ncbi:hypothetical protein G6F40_017339 [Rhizopus arrhizus]|nr:hypothetical protein G6F40_017339 [Rhizopus arrhizus]
MQTGCGRTHRGKPGSWGRPERATKQHCWPAAAGARTPGGPMPAATRHCIMRPGLVTPRWAPRWSKPAPTWRPSTPTGGRRSTSPRFTGTPGSAST